VEHVYRVLINTIIHNFKQIGVTVKAKQQILVDIALHRLIIQEVLNGLVNGFFGNIVLESSLGEGYRLVHGESVLQNAAFGKKSNCASFSNRI
jgi:hypothetical protein